MHISQEFQKLEKQLLNNFVFSALGKSDLSHFYEYGKTLYKTRRRETVSCNKIINAFF